MLRIFCLGLALMAISGSHADAQLKGFSLGAYAETAWPDAGFNTTHKQGIGGGVNADVRLGKLGLTGSAGFMRFGGKMFSMSGTETKSPTLNAIPIRLGLKYRIIPLLYTKIESGVVKFSNGSGSAVIISPGLGVRVLGLDVQGKYEMWIRNGSSGFWGVKVGYNF
ncbi:MAG: hypothetical protein H7Y42_15795 [Chitinophagaceae bacterium]|nr:hypothetical protein [Chitinophagaceae bacterium]